jgi:hypothetical protein
VNGERWDSDPMTRFIVKETGLSRETVDRISEAWDTLIMEGMAQRRIDTPSPQQLAKYIADKTGIAEADVARVFQAMERWGALGFPKLKNEPS